MMAEDRKSDVVLVVDDSAETLGMLSQALDEEGLTVLIALDGEQAINIASKMTPDIILLDAIMPNIDGFETCRRMKQNAGLKNTPIIFMTGLSDTEHIVMGLEAGGVDYISKPINPQELVARMRVHLANARMTQSARVALDNAGQNIFTTDSVGQMLWATPQVFALFEAALADSKWLETMLAPLLRSWLDRTPEQGHKLSLDAPLKKLQCKYLGEVSANEHLFRLFEEDGGSDEDVLKKTFALTEREAEVLLWIAHGKTNREIAQILDMSPRTVNKHLEQVFKKLGVENRTAAASVAIRLLSEAGRLG
ncbi:DNA-binding response regulator [Ketobacter sp.]|uniref:response regulator transcription factor n=1 Tax=Ketobacter sp. TaxID=2083498 RepID=UPI000F1D3284|nr:DNA-binding response regulator [Ketobacter sp.]RLU00816.1 MAG: DNA-binding response regulator [Ketobacter sp.]